MRPRQRTSVLGPYKNGNSFLVVIITPAGKRSSSRCATEGEALALAGEARAEAQIAEGTIESLLDRYEEHLRAKGNKPKSNGVTLMRLRSLLGVRLSGPLSRITATEATTLYQALAARTKADTHRNTLSEMKTFWGWLIKKGYARTNTWETVEALGKRNRQKRQLRRDDARTFGAYCLGQAKEGKASALAALLALVLGLRSGEIVSLTPASLDDGGKVLRVQDAKTPTGDREVVVPSMLRGLLQERAAGTPVGSCLFAHLPEWVGKTTKKLCVKAGVAVVGAHSLRGTQASLSIAAGATPELVAATLGHASIAVTLGHYINPQVKADTLSERATTFLG